jgi:CheY-like chemotaxis protein
MPSHEKDPTPSASELFGRLSDEIVQRVLARLQELETVALAASGVAHDFNNLLTGVLGHIDLARVALPEGSVARSRLDDAALAAESARGLSLQLLELASGGPSKGEPHSLAETLRSSTRFVLAGSLVAGVLSVPDDLWACPLDRTQVRQIVDNLLLNARQAMPNGGRVQVTARNVEVSGGEPHGVAPGRYVEVTIADDGPGIPPEIRDRLFEPFFTTKSSGTGLGLSTAQSKLTRAGGSIDFESIPGHGTRFRLLFKAAQAEAGAARRTESLRAVRGARILAMDDEPAIRALLKLALERAGHEVTLASNGDEAARGLESALHAGRSYDLAILDLTVAGGPGGIETLAVLRRLDPTLHAIASSGYGSSAGSGELDAAGFDGVLPKPYTVTQLAGVVNRALAKRRG